MTPSKDRLAWAVAGFHRVETGVPGCAVGASSRPRSVAWSIAYPAGSLNEGPEGAPVRLTSWAVAAVLLISVPGG